MTVAAIARVIKYVEDGTTVTFAVPFAFLSADDLHVTRLSDDGIETALAPVLNFSVSGGNGGSGAITITSGPYNGQQLVIAGSTVIEQQTAYTEGDRFPAKSHEGALDRLTMIAQEQRDAIGDVGERAALLPKTDAQRGAVVGQFAVVLPGGEWGFASGTGADPGLRPDLGSTDSDKGASLVGYDPLQPQAAGTAGGYLSDGYISLQGVCTRGNAAGVSAQNKTLVQTLLANCVTQKKALLIPAGEWYIDGGIQCLTGLVPIVCEGTVYTNTTTALITMKAIGGAGAAVRGFYIRGGKFVNLNGTQAQKNSSIVKFQSDGAYILTPSFIGVDGYGFYQMFDNDAGTYVTSFGNESLMNHGLVDGCVPHYYVTLNAKYLFRHRTGSGTGWIYTNCRDDLAVGSDPNYTDPVGTELIGVPAHVRVEAGGINAVVSDILFEGHVSGKFAGAVSIDGACAYRSNISMGPLSQIDAQARRAIFFDPMPPPPVINFSILPANVGGDIDIAKDFPRCVGGRFPAQGFSEAEGGRYDSNAPGPGPQTLPLVEIQMQSGFGCEVELWATGETFGVLTGAIRKRTYAIRHDGTTVIATDITALGFNNPSSIPSGFFDFAASIVSDTVTINVAYSATAAGSKLAAHYKVTAGAWRVRRLQ